MTDHTQNAVRFVASSDTLIATHTRTHTDSRRLWQGLTLCLINAESLHPYSKVKGPNIDGSSEGERVRAQIVSGQALAEDTR